MIEVLHNPRCGKSRNCLAFLDEKNIEYTIVKYLENPLDTNEIEILLKKLNLEPIDLIRQKEPIWIENYKGKKLSDKELIKLIQKHPILIERPIVISKNYAVIARDLSKSEVLFNKVLGNQS